MDDNTIKKCNNCAPEGLEYQLNNGRPQVMISENYMSEARDGVSYMQQASMLADMMARGEFGPDIGIRVLPPSTVIEHTPPPLAMTPPMTQEAPTIESPARGPAGNFTLAQTDAGDVLPSGTLQRNWEEAGEDGSGTGEVFIPRHSKDYADELGREDSTWPRYPVGDTPLKHLSCGHQVTYEDRFTFEYSRVVKEEIVGVLSLSGNWNLVTPFLGSGTISVPRSAIGLPPDEVQNVKELAEKADEKAMRLYFDMMRAGEFDSFEEFHEENLSEREVLDYLDRVTSDTDCEVPCKKVVSLDHWYASLSPVFDTSIDFRPATPQPVDLGPDRFLWEAYAQVKVTVRVSIACIFTVKCVYEWL